MNDLVYASAHQLAEAIHHKHISAYQVLEAHLAQISKHNTAVNAVVTLDEEAAVRRAREADMALARGEIWGPLHGVPVTFKDCFETAGLRTTSGSPLLADYIPTTDATVVSRLRAAGAIVLGKTNLPPFTGGAQTDNPVFGRTNNPWDLTCTPGGSSGGSAAAVATGMSPLDIGSDVGGSVRNPAHFCGVYALKPTDLLVSTAGHVHTMPGSPDGLRHQLVAGPLARSVEDLSLALQLTAGTDGRRWETPPILLESRPERDIRELCLAWTEDLGGILASMETRSALADLVSELDRTGCRIEQRIPARLDIMAALETHGELYQVEVSSAMPSGMETRQAREYARRGYTLDSPDPVARGMARGFQASMRQYTELLAQRDRLITQMEQFLKQWDALLCPVTSGPALKHRTLDASSPGQDAWFRRPTNDPVDVDGQTVPFWVALCGFTGLFSLTGHPAVVLPLARSTEGLPIGLQIVGRRWGDMQLLAVARKLAEIIGPFQPPPNYQG